ncbi:MAG TPA: MFS transporter [Hyphomicrobiaceae bacterium]|nr:MFS transporter [Hyphomicrobiaceae bacterium]
MRSVLLPILVTLYLLGFSNLFLRSSFGVMAPELEREMGMSPALLSTVASAFFIAYALMQIPTGMMLDRFGPRRVLSAMMLFTAIGTALFAAGETAQTLTFGRILMGIGCSGAFTGAFYILAMWMTPERVVTQTGALNSFAAVGNLCATAPFAALIALIGWRESYWLFTAGIVLLMIALALFVRDTPPDHPPRQVKNERLGAVLAGVREAVRQPGMRRMLFTGLPMSAGGLLSGAWGAPYLKHVHGLDDIERGSVLLLMALGGIGGHFFYGRIARRINSLKRPVLVGGTVVLVMVLALALLSKPPLMLVTVIFVAISICSAYPTVSHAHARGLVPARLMGRGVAASNMGIMTAIAGAQFMFGWILSAFPAIAGAPPEVAYRTAFGAQAGVALIGLLIFLRVPDVRPRG